MHQLILASLNNSGIQKTNPALYQTIYKLANFVGILDTLPTTDFGAAFLKSGDTNGTKVNFNKTFTSAFVTANVVQATAGYVSIVTVSNTYFLARAFNTSGTQINATINWTAFGS